MFGYLSQDLKITCIYSILVIGGLCGLGQGEQEISEHRNSRSTDAHSASHSSSRSSDDWSGAVRRHAQRVDCRIGSIQNGYRVIRRTWSGYEALFSCNHGYCLLGNPRLMCGIDGVWNGEWPVCVRDIPECGDPETPQFGSRFITGTLEGSSVNYSCPHPGYILRGNSQRTCQQNGRWSGSLPVCKKVDCGSPRRPRHGVVRFSFTLYGWTVAFQCSFGYVMKGAKSAVCDESGRWSRNPPTCRVVRCGHLWDPAHGRVSYGTRMFGSIATYSCNYGYGLDGSQTRTCKASGRWSGLAPHCRRNVCDSLRNPKNGRVSYYSVTVRSEATYTCNHGYVISGSWRRVCYARGWSGTEPTCYPIRCPVLISPSNCHVTTSNQDQVYSVANYTCERGYRMIGSSTRQCRPNGFWSNQEPGCYRIDCGYLHHIPNGKVKHKGTTVGSEAMYTCYPEFNLKLGDRIRTCLENGTWSGTKPCCIHPSRIIKCMPLQNPDNGTVELSGVKVGSIATYTCENGSFLVGDDQRMCQYNGKWSGEPPICVVPDCPDLEPPENGEVVLSGRFIGDNATYTCNAGFELIGSSVRTCLETDVWSGSEPECNIADCPKLAPPENGEISITGRRIGDNATYSCDIGFELTGSAIRTCLGTGNWSGSAPTCIRQCEDPGIPVNGRRIIVPPMTNNFTTGTRVYFTCNDGYEIQGTNTRLCQDNDTWTSTTPGCLLANSTCIGTGEMMDQFGRQCTCIGEQLVSCSRYRRDWTTLTDEEKQAYISTVLTVATDPQYRPLYNLLIERYLASSSTLAQSTAPDSSQFYPWHRYFLLEYEDLLRLVNSNITIPYWDWSLLPTVPYSSPVFDPITGFGNSSNVTTMCVATGPFRETVFQVTPSAGEECLRRAYSDFTYPSRSIIQSEALNFPAFMFNDFHRSLQLFFHLNVRCFVGGHMCEPNASNDPLYLLHLAMIDLIFDCWQSLDAERATVRYAGDNNPLVLTFDDSLIVSNFFDNRNLPYNVSVRYAPQQNISNMDTPTGNTDTSPDASSLDPTCTATSTATTVTDISTADATTTAIVVPTSAIAVPTPIIAAQSVVIQNDAQQLMAESSSAHPFTIYHKITFMLVAMVAVCLFL